MFLQSTFLHKKLKFLTYLQKYSIQEILCLSKEKHSLVSFYHKVKIWKATTSAFSSYCHHLQCSDISNGVYDIFNTYHILIAEGDNKNICNKESIIFVTNRDNDSSITNHDSSDYEVPKDDGDQSSTNSDQSASDRGSRRPINNLIDDRIEGDLSESEENNEQISSDKTTLRHLLSSLNIKKDIDSLMLCSSDPFSLLSSINADAVSILYPSISRMKSSKGARFNVMLDEDSPIRFRNTKVRSLSLGSFPNITLAKVNIRNLTFFFNMYWLGPDFIPKVPYFDDEMLMVIIASLNFARFSCENNLYAFDDLDFNSNVTNLQMKYFVKRQAIDCIPRFSVADKTRKNKDQYIELKTVTVFFGEMKRCLEAMSNGVFQGLSIKDLLPYDYDHKLFSKCSEPEDKFDILANNALRLTNSITFTLTVSNIKAVCCSQYFHKNMSQSPVLDNVIGEKFDKFERACDDLLTDMMKQFLAKEDIPDNVHVYYDYGLEANSIDPSLSLLVSLLGGFSEIENLIHEHNATDDISMTDEQFFELAESLLQDYEQEQDRPPENVSEYLSWFTGMQKRKYRTFFMNDTGNWHTGGNRIKRVMSEDKIELEHRASPGMCSAQGYSPQSRKIQHKLLRTAFKHMDGLPHAMINLLRQKEWKQPQSSFTIMLKNVLTHLKEIEDHSSVMRNNQISIRYECMMKLCPSTKKVQFPDGFMDLPVVLVKTEELGIFYHDKVVECTQSIYSLFPNINEKRHKYDNIGLFSPEVKTMLVLQCELLAYEFGESNKKGTIMKELKNTFKNQGFVGISSHSCLRLPLGEVDSSYTSNIKNGLSPSLLPISLETSFDKIGKGGIDVSNVTIPVSYSSLMSSPIFGASVSSKIPVTFEQHKHLITSILHQFLEKSPEILLSSTNSEDESDSTPEKNLEGIGLFSIPNYCNVKNKTLQDIKKFLEKITQILWSLYRREWWKSITSLLSKTIKTNISFELFPTNVKEVHELFIFVSEISEDEHGKISSKIISKQETIKYLGKFVVI